MESVKQFIVLHNKKPPKTTNIGCWLSDQLCFFRGNKGWAANPEFAERKAVFEDFLRTHETYLMTRDEIWDNKLKEVDDFIVLHNRLPTGTTNKSLSVWWLEQVSQAKTNKMPENRIDKWKAFIEKHNNILYAEHDLWNANLQKSINFIEENHKRPSSASKHNEEKIIGQWIVNQLQAKTLDIDKQTLWNQFLDNYCEYFLLDDEMWNKNMEDTKIYYDSFNKLPSHTSKCDIERKLGIWVQTQKKNLKLDKFVNADRKTVWTTFMRNIQNITTPAAIQTMKHSDPIVERQNNKCAGKDRNNNCCRYNASYNSKYCKYHAYMTEYTDDIIATLQF
jgi:hypothetical protein